ncbi:DUF4124 domain-containing protein [Microbulbifer flavimaris]|uniref:DUF4124 domain-containing protein n=1 Tax=Microbulbifer flavimaris TaxID=1781068 RepID=A0ABX4I139_9GAMM|nr:MULTISPECIES: DUF4124 domain-containing protein [Microbulbifer]KUJ83854.1 hypothetical protein AVO43_08515 [Microbulbifer sp. ZGT114]PCO06031.1 DUF4124 domain-containing protein [Microbulbifer flavimaris]
MKKHYGLLIALLTIAAPALAGSDGSDESASSGSVVYKTVGPDGSVVFTDTPPPDGKAERIELGPVNVQPRPMPNRKLSPKKQDTDDRPRAYAGPVNFAIVSPTNGATITPGQRFIVMQVAIEPLPPQGHQVFAVVDGQPWLGSSSGNRLDISALERGSHTLQAVLTDPGGNVLARSQIINLYVQRPGDQVPDFPGAQAPKAPRSPAAPALSRPKQPRGGN